MGERTSTKMMYRRSTKVSRYATTAKHKDAIVVLLSLERLRGTDCSHLLYGVGHGTFVSWEGEEEPQIGEYMCHLLSLMQE